jgi:hypothetical protein
MSGVRVTPIKTRFRAIDGPQMWPALAASPGWHLRRVAMSYSAAPNQFVTSTNRVAAASRFLCSVFVVRDGAEQAGEAVLDVVAAQCDGALTSCRFVCDQPGFAQRLEVVGVGRLGHGPVRGVAFGDGERAACRELANEVESRRVAEREQNLRERDVGEVWVRKMPSGVGNHK